QTGADALLARSRAVRQLRRAKENDAVIRTLAHSDYPRNVYESNNPVPLLYVRGNQEVLKQRLAVACVGSRNTREPYVERHREFAQYAAQKGFAIVSGFALGADAIGHAAAFQAGGQTVL